MNTGDLNEKEFREWVVLRLESIERKNTNIVNVFSSDSSLRIRLKAFTFHIIFWFVISFFLLIIGFVFSEYNFIDFFNEKSIKNTLKNTGIQYLLFLIGNKLFYPMLKREFPDLFDFNKPKKSTSGVLKTAIGNKSKFR